jgi:hypothetical protein
MKGLTVPIVLVVFNRPDRVAESFAAVRAARPQTLLVVADGPRPGHPDDPERCRAARAVVDAVDWPCEVLRALGDENLGTDRRIPLGLDWAFSHVDRAIVLEDDIVPVAGFFPWCEAMLERYDAVDDVMHVSGHNVLVHWPPSPVDHLLVRRGSVYGWATWASAWRGVDHELAGVRDATEAAVARQLGRLDLDPLVYEHLALHVRAAADGTLAAWDTRWDLARILAGGWCVIPPVNLVSNRGYGADATRTVHADDLGAALPCGRAPAVAARGPQPDPDPDYDRRSLLLELLATYREPVIAARLARARQLLVTADGAPDLRALHHLAPFDQLDESIAVLEHLRAEGVVGATLDQLCSALRDEADRRSRAAT